MNISKRKKDTMLMAFLVFSVFVADILMCSAVLINMNLIDLYPVEVQPKVMAICAAFVILSICASIVPFYAARQLKKQTA